jgi:dTDP-4-amino-4,6-dideoxygalactose transaminase
MIPISKPQIGPEEEKAVLEVLRSGNLAQGEKVVEFEEAFARYCGVKYAVATDNGTSALMVAVVAAGIKEGDEVITTPFTFIATGNAILFAGAKPVFVDIDPVTFNLDSAKIEEAITKKTKAIVPVHLYGLMADMKAINSIAKKHNLLVIEDAAQAHGASIAAKKAGSWGDLATFSFYPTKNMTTGEGGMVTTNDPSIAQKARLFRNQGMDRRYYHDTVGYNFRLTNIGAAIGLAQLKKVENFAEKRIQNAKYLTENLSQVEGITVPTVPAGYRHVFHQYTIRTKERSKLIKRLEKEDIGHGVYYPVLVQEQVAYKGLEFVSFETPKAKRATEEVLSLPVHPGLTQSDLDKIVEVVSG